MLCQNCGDNEANIKYTQIVNGVRKEMILCEKCAEKLGINNFKINMPIHFSNFLEDLFDDYNNDQLLPSFMKENHNKCNNCGELYNDFLKTGLLGCAECYEMFEDRLDYVLKNMQSNVKHVGRKPLNISEKMSNIGENNVKSNIDLVEKVKNDDQNIDNKKNNEIEKLQKDLDKAIKEERYEDAAVIRDKIKEINDNK